MIRCDNRTDVFDVCIAQTMGVSMISGFFKETSFIIILPEYFKFENSLS